MTGCGKKKGLQVALDSRQIFRMQNLGGRGRKSRKKPLLASTFKVFITAPGGVTSKVSLFKQNRKSDAQMHFPFLISKKVPFTVDPSFHGEHSFYLHGIHVIKTTEAFRYDADANVRSNTHVFSVVLFTCAEVIERRGLLLLLRGELLYDLKGQGQLFIFFTIFGVGPLDP